MFEKRPTNQNQPASPAGTPAASAGEPPQNLPTSGPVSPRGGPTPPPRPRRPTPPKEPFDKLKTEPEDILAGIDKAEPEVREPAKPISPVGRRAEPMKAPLPPAVKPPEKPVTKEPFFKQHQKAFVIIVIVLIAGGVLAVGGWYGYKLFVAPQPGPATPSVNTGQPTNQNVNQPAVNQNVNVNQPPPPPLDTDRDGLPDEEEEMYGTDPNKVDTDKDGLTDRDEVKVFKTDPNNPDTDGDGYLDGEEIRGGYDPKGPGRLLKIE